MKGVSERRVTAEREEALFRRESGLSDRREGSVQRQGVKVVRRDKFSEWKGQRDREGQE